MKREEQFLMRLFAAAAREAKREQEDAALPAALATRIAAQWAGGAGGSSAAWLWEQWSLRAALAGLAVSAVLLGGSLAWPGQSQAREARAVAELEFLLSIR